MRRRLTSAVPVVLGVLLLVGVLGGCARTSSSDLDKMQPGTPVTVTMKDGSVVSGRFVQAKPDSLVVDPAEGGEWKTLPRDQIASVGTEQAPNAQAQPQSGQAPGTPAGTSTRNGATRSHTARRAGGGTTPAYSEPAGTAPAMREVEVPAGTLLHVRLDTTVASDTSHVEQPVQATVTEPVVIDGYEAVPAGSALKGIVTDARPSGKVKGRAEVAFRFNTLAVGSNQEHSVRTQLIAREAEGTKKKDALKIGAPAAGGAILGGILGGKKGALIGGAIGGGAGTAVVMSTPGEEVRLPAGTAVTVKLVEPITVRVAIDR